MPLFLVAKEETLVAEVMASRKRGRGMAGDLQTLPAVLQPRSWHSGGWPRRPFRSILFLVSNSFLFLVVRPVATSSVLAPSSDARSPYYLVTSSNALVTNSDGLQGNRILGVCPCHLFRQDGLIDTGLVAEQMTPTKGWIS